VKLRAASAITDRTRMADPDAKSRWTQIIAMMSADGHLPLHAPVALRVHWPVDATIRVIDRLSGDCVTVAWAHACSGHYGAQLWRKVIARRRAVCAISGETVHRGEAVYKLFRSMDDAPNRHAVLLARHVDAML
jgi:hypothetical protein